MRWRLYITYARCIAMIPIGIISCDKIKRIPIPRPSEKKELIDLVTLTTESSEYKTLNLCTEVTTLRTYAEERLYINANFWKSLEPSRRFDCNCCIFWRVTSKYLTCSSFLFVSRARFVLLNQKFPLSLNFDSCAE